jgi:hypothetical protein
MHDIFIYRITSCFTISVILWALFAYAELWINGNLRLTKKIFSRLLHAESTKTNTSDPPDYMIIQGFYKERKIVCRMCYFSPSRFLRYDLRLHIHIEPNKRIGQKLRAHLYPTENTQLDYDNNINYACTSSTVLKSYFFASMIQEDEFIQIFEELTRAAEIIEAGGT